MDRRLRLVGERVRRRILLADDHALLREALRRLLEARGDLEVVAEAADGHEAVALARHYRPDLALVDLTMPRLDGAEAIRRIRRDCDSCRVLVLSMHEDWSRLSSALRAGASGYLAKSASAAELLGAIDDVLAGRSFVSPRLTDAILKRGRGHETIQRGPLSLLTNREREVLRLVAEGRTSKQVALDLGVSVKTVDAHRTSLMRKLDVHKASELVRLAVREGLIQA